MKKKLLEGKALEERAKELGCYFSGPDTIMLPVGSDWELQRRVIEAERSIRESRLWIVALISAIASVVSALTAIIAVLRN
jgi:type IV secretory pathway component VirB8